MSDATRDSYIQNARHFLEDNRDRSFMEHLLPRFVTHLQPGALVLDVGAGPGFDTVLLRERGLRAVAVDYARGMLELADGPRVLADMRALPFAAVDGLFVNAALLHIPHADAPATLGGFRRVLREGGALFLSVKEGDGEKWFDDPKGIGLPRLFTFWRPEDLSAALSDAGFSVVDSWGSTTPKGDWLCRVAIAN